MSGSGRALVVAGPCIAGGLSASTLEVLQLQVFVVALDDESAILSGGCNGE